MDQAVTPEWRVPTTFNSPLEAGVRIVAILTAAHPQAFDLQRVVAFDHLLVHTGDIGGPSSLHPPVPMRSAELIVRQRLIERALLLMMTRELVSRQIGPDGFRYLAGENAVPFLGAIQSDYVKGLQDRAHWLVRHLGPMPEGDSRILLRGFFDRWVQEFQSVERSMGTEP